MRNRIFGVIGVVWGGSVLYRRYMAEGAQGETGLAAGHSAGLVVATLLFVIGCYYLFLGGPKGRQE